MDQYPLSDEEVLAEFRLLLGHRVAVSVNAFREFLGVAFAGELRLARTLPPDHRAIELGLSGGQSLFFDPAELDAHRFSHGAERWLELTTPAGLTVMIEADAAR